jgi:hypothetical protein
MGEIGARRDDEAKPRRNEDEMIEFTIPGKVTSANLVTRHVGKLAIKSASARLDHARIRDYALVALRQREEHPLKAAVTITAYNSRLDADNLPKCILDGIKGILIVNDSPKHLRRLVVEHVADKLGERYTVRVEAH